MSESLLPCPFCGCKAILRRSKGFFNMWNEYRVECPYCNDEYWIMNDYEKAIKKWNTRHPPSDRKEEK